MDYDPFSYPLCTGDSISGVKHLEREAKHFLLSAMEVFHLMMLVAKFGKFICVVLELEQRITIYN
jgi:hypothetical protein